MMVDVTTEESNFAELELELRKVPGIKSARVVGDDRPTEIHIVANSNRPPKQLVRDVQSLSAAGFGIPIDHRIVSIVRVDDAEPAAEAPPATAAQSESNGHRPVVERVVLASKGDDSWVKVALKWPDGETSEGAGAAGASRDTRARGATVALVNAMEGVLDAHRARIDIEHVMVHRIGTHDSVLVRAVYYERGAPTPVVGSALVYDDVATAAVRALLQAINRKLSSE
jgi:hypothetical protein